MKVEFKKYGTSLGTRETGKEIRNTILETLKNEEDIIFDFDGVSILSNSFADEVFGKLIGCISFEKFKEKTKFQNINDTVKTVILKAINDSI